MKMKKKSCYLFLWLLLLVITTTASMADTGIPRNNPESRPTVGLVLSGGGARGAAHIGVLKVLEEMRIPIDFIAGTSMGSIVGGLYASGMTVEEIEKTINSIDWADALQDDPSRKDRSFRRKKDDDLFLVKSRPGFSDGEVKLPSGFIQGQKIDLIFKSLTLPVVSIDDFDNLTIPYRAIATDIVSGDAVVIGSGDLAKAMRASMSVPAIFSPVEIYGKLLVDGGVSNNLPMDVAREMGADILIVVDISTPLLKREEIGSALGVTSQLTGILTRRNTEAKLKTLSESDILIVPDLGDITTASFDRSAEAIPMGVKAAREKKVELSRLSLKEETYTEYLAAQKRTREGIPVIAFVRLHNRSRINDDVINSFLSVEVGKPLDVAAIEADIGRLYGLELFENISYDIIEEEGKTGLAVYAREKSWGPNYLQFGITNANNFEGNNTFNASISYTQTAMNSLNGEWRTILQVGEEPSFSTEFYQPFGHSTRYFFLSRLSFESKTFNVFDDREHIAEYRVNRYGLEAAAGREFGTWGEARIGVRSATGDGDIQVGDPAFSDIDFDIGEVYARLSLDELDNPDFPRSGVTGWVEWVTSVEELGADISFDQVLFRVLGANSWGRHTFLGGLRFNTTLDSDAPIQSMFQAGGFLNLSGYNPNELTGQHYCLAEFIYYRRIGDFNLMPTYLGFSLETGNVWEEKDDIAFDDTISAGSIFVGVDTVLAPLYLGYGIAEGGSRSAYFYLGRLF
jgi:NTE family protein